MTALRAALKEGGLNDQTSSYPGGWALGLVITEALRKCDSGCAKPSNFESALEKINVDTDGLTGVPIQLAADDHYGPSAYRLYKYDNKARMFSAVGDWLHIGSNGKISE